MTHPTLPVKLPSSYCILMVAERFIPSDRGHEQRAVLEVLCEPAPNTEMRRRVQQLRSSQRMVITEEGHLKGWFILDPDQWARVKRWAGESYASAWWVNGTETVDLATGRVYTQEVLPL